MEYFLVAGASEKDLVVTGFLEGLTLDGLGNDRLGTLLGPALRHELMRLRQA